MRKMLIKTIISAIFLGFNISVHAELPFNTAYVFTEDQYGDDIACDINPDRLAETAKSILRYNRISITQNSNTADLIVYINHVTLDSKLDFCTYNLRMEMYKYGNITLPKKTVIGSHVLCIESGLGQRRKYDMRSRLNESIREKVETCLSKIESK